VPFRLRRGDASFGDLLNDLAARLTATTGLLTELLGEPRTQLRASLPALRAAEQGTDAAANAVLRALSSAIVTPFDRVDVYRVAWSLRVCVVRITAAAEDMVELQLEDVPPVVTDLVQLITRASDVAADAVRRIHQPDLLADSALELHRLGRQAREAHRDFLAGPDLPAADAAVLIRRAAVAASLLAGVESFEHLACALQTVAVKEG
jgi:uncharacterized protein